MKKFFKIIIIFVGVVLPMSVIAFSRGIYLTQSTAQDHHRIHYLIQQAKRYGIDTFVIDINRPSANYADNIKTVVHSGIRYIARVVVFPHGGTDAQVRDQKIWEKRLALARYAEQLGAQDIQLDYIRYQARAHISKIKAQRIYEVVQYFKKHLREPLQVDIFGVAAHQPAHTIGQDPALLASIVDAFCPMVYPSHYEPFRYHATRPYETVLSSVEALKKQLVKHDHVHIYAYIESHNYRYPLSTQQKMRYIAAQMKAAQDGGANGWYVWSANNHYHILFQVLSQA